MRAYASGRRMSTRNASRAQLKTCAGEEMLFKVTSALLT